MLSRLFEILNNLTLSPSARLIEFGNELDKLKTSICESANVSPAILVDLLNKSSPNSVLQVAAFRGHKEIVALLIDLKVNIDLQNKSGNTALMFAISQNRMDDIASLLIAAGANVNVSGLYQNTALLLAIKHQRKSLVSPLLEVKASIDHRGESNHTALSLAIEHKDTHSVKLLLEAKADFNHVCHGHSVLWLSIQQENNLITQQLLNAKANLLPDEKQKELYSAASECNFATVHYLLEAKADITLTEDNEKPEYGRYRKYRIGLGGKIELKETVLTESVAFLVANKIGTACVKAGIAYRQNSPVSYTYKKHTEGFDDAKLISANLINNFADNNKITETTEKFHKIGRCYRKKYTIKVIPSQKTLLDDRTLYINAADQGLAFQSIQENYVEMGALKWNELPQDFPRTNDLIIKNQKQLIPILKEKNIIYDPLKLTLFEIHLNQQLDRPYMSSYKIGGAIFFPIKSRITKLQCRFKPGKKVYLENRELLHALQYMENVFEQTKKECVQDVFTFMKHLIMIHKIRVDINKNRMTDKAKNHANQEPDHPLPKIKKNLCVQFDDHVQIIPSPEAERSILNRHRFFRNASLITMGALAIGASIYFSM